MESHKFIRNRIATLYAPHVLKVVEKCNLELLPDKNYVRILINFCAVCGTDISFYDGNRESNFPLSIGHEYCGKIIACGKNVNNLKINDFVTVDPNYRCGTCIYCSNNQSNLCDKSALNLFSNRGFSKYVDIHKSYILKIPKLKNLYKASLIESLSCAIHAIDLGLVSNTDTIMIIGAGGMGTMISFSLSINYPQNKKYVCDTIHQKAIKLEKVFPIQSIDILDNGNNSDIQYFSLIFEASGHPTGFEYACKHLSRNGRIVIISRYDGYNEIPFLYQFLARKQSKIIFSHLNGDGKTMGQAYKELKDHWTKNLDSLVTIKDLNEIQEVFKNYKSSLANKTVIKIA